MQIDPSVLKLPRLPPHVVQPKDENENEVANVPFADLVFKLADGVARGQRRLDETTAQTMSLLAETTVEMPSKVERRVESDGRISMTDPEYEERSLLELGFEPTRYQFSEATVEVNFDLTISEKETVDETREGDAKPTYNMRAGTYEATEQRKYNRTLETNATMNAKLEPVPLPVEISPAESTTSAEGNSETTDGNTDSETTDETTNDSDSDATGETTNDSESETTDSPNSDTTDDQSES